MPDNHTTSPAAFKEQKTRKRRKYRNWWYLLVLLPLAGLLYPPLYSRIDPKLAGFPFFIWYQFAWILGGVAVTYVIYRLTD